MVFDPPSAASHPPGNPASPRGTTKFSIRFRKAGDLRLVSHHDLMHCFERMLRRAELPVLHSHGFNPRPKLVFAQSLALGIVGCAEVAELELDGSLCADDVYERLARQCPPGLEILSVRAIDAKLKGRVRRGVFLVEIPPQRCGETETK